MDCCLIDSSKAFKFWYTVNERGRKGDNFDYVFKSGLANKILEKGYGTREEVENFARACGVSVEDLKR